MKYYVGQIISVFSGLPSDTGIGPQKKPMLGIIIDGILHHYESCVNKIKVHSIVNFDKDCSLEIELDEDGNPSAGQFME